MKADDIYRDITEDVETRFDTSNYELDRQLPKGKNVKIIGLIEDELGGIIMINNNNNNNFFWVKSKNLQLLHR